jgi:hypothetical protein
MIARSLSSDNREAAALPGAMIFFSLNFETAIGSKSAKTSLQMKLVYKLHLSIQLLQEGRDCE